MKKYNWKRIRQLYNEGRSYAEITAKTGARTSAIDRALAHYREHEDEYVERPLCRCGLSLPCNQCLTAASVVTSGPGHLGMGVQDVD